MFPKFYKVSKQISICPSVMPMLLLLLLLFLHICLLCSLCFVNAQGDVTNKQIELCQTLNETVVGSGEVDETVDLLAAFQVFEVNRQAAESGRSYVCVPLFRIFNLEIRQTLGPNQAVAVTGDHATLGQWQIAKSLALNAQNEERTKWYLKVWVCASQRIYYRYFIYEPDGRGQKQVRQWEGQQTARMLQTYELYRRPGVDVFGDIYGADIGGGIQRERGWLRQEYVIELKFNWWRHIYLPGIGRNRNYKLLLQTLVRQSASSINSALIEVSRYAYNRSQLRTQTAERVTYKEGAIVVFRITQPLKVRNAFKLLISDMSKREIGEVYILPASLRGSRGKLQLPIYSSQNGFQIGQLLLPYLIVRPLPEAVQINLRGSFHHYWPLNWPTMDVGHRGAGASYYHIGTAHVENTIKSFLSVPSAKGDMVEFDVQLTRDYVAVIWHGFGFYTAQADKAVVDFFDLEYVLIKDLSYEELKASRVFVPTRGSVHEYSHYNVKNVSYAERIFPTLAEVYQSLPKTLGLLIEIKWPQLMESGVMESPQTLNKNVYVNELLQTTTKYGCGRAIVFTSFDADICTMIRLKQNAFGVMLMTTGRTLIWDPYMDLRTQNYLNAVNYVEAADILGSVVHVANFQANKRLLNLGLDLMQTVFLWGNDLRNADLNDYYRKLDVTGLIYDQIEVNGPAAWKRAGFFNAMELLEIFGRQCVAIGNSTILPGIKPPKPTIWPKL